MWEGLQPMIVRSAKSPFVLILSRIMRECVDAKSGRPSEIVTENRKQKTENRKRKTEKLDRERLGCLNVLVYLVY